MRPPGTLNKYNEIAGNSNNGIEFTASSNTGNVVFGNGIGTSHGGFFAIGNGNVGIVLGGGASGNEIGGPFGGNYISDNAAGGIYLGTGSGNSDASLNFVQNNIVGLDQAQSVVLGIQYLGLYVAPGSTGNQVNGNVFAGATQNGALVASATGNAIDQNWIGVGVWGGAYTNGAFGICLLSGASYNYIQGNNLGSNVLGSFYVDPNAMGNVIN